MPGTSPGTLLICRGGKTQNSPVTPPSKVGGGKAQPKATKEGGPGAFPPENIVKLEGKSGTQCTFGIPSQEIMLSYFVCKGRVMPY